MNVRIEPSWKKVLNSEFKKPYFKKLAQFVKNEYQKHTVYPQGSQIFAAFDSCPFDKTKVIILGQDPYHGPNQAHGLCFSVADQVPIPPSLLNIYKEIYTDLGTKSPHSGNLTRWTKQGILLLNATLTVRARQAGSHQDQGWEELTSAAIKALSDQKKHLTFLLWGKYAQQKGQVINEQKHLVLKSPHPSPFSVHYGFFGNKHFSQTNAYLKKHNSKPINW